MKIFLYYLLMHFGSGLAAPDDHINVSMHIDLPGINRTPLEYVVHTVYDS